MFFFRKAAHVGKDVAEQIRPVPSDVERADPARARPAFIIKSSFFTIGIQDSSLGNQDFSIEN